MQAIEFETDVVNGQIELPPQLKNKPFPLHLRIIAMFDDYPNNISMTVANKQLWPEDFFKDTAGCFADTPLSRPNQGEFESRAEIL